jgi:AP-4 complex subunit mu-1
VLSEDAIRKNFSLIYELLDEVIDYGFPQSTSTEALRTFVLNEPTVVLPQVHAGMPGSFGAAQLTPRHAATLQGQRQSPLFALSKGPTGVFKSVLDTNRTDGKHKDEIFVDVVERVTCTFNAGGYIATSQIDGAIQVRAFGGCSAALRRTARQPRGMLAGRR